MLSTCNFERYRYNSFGLRLTKCLILHPNLARQQAHYYLPGVEIHNQHHVGKSVRDRYALSLLNLRLLRTLSQSHLRYNVTEANDSTTLELDPYANIVSCEVYYPFGGTAVWAGRGAQGSEGKIRRFAGKERDITGLIHYGLRYYAPWLLRWFNSDPAGTQDGLNLYRMVRNNPITLSDPDGCMPKKCSAKPLTHRADSARPGASTDTVTPSLAIPVASASAAQAGGDDHRLKQDIKILSKQMKQIAAGHCSVVFDIGNREVLKIYPDKKQFKKLPKGVNKPVGCHHDLIPLPAQIATEVLALNKTHGPGTARVIGDDRLVMSNLGIPLTRDILSNITEDAVNSLCEQLNRLHKAGFWHKNMTESNILRDENNKLNIIGFSNAAFHGREFRIDSYDDVLRYLNEMKGHYPKNMGYHNLLSYETNSYWLSNQREFWSQGHFRNAYLPARP